MRVVLLTNTTMVYGIKDNLHMRNKCFGRTENDYSKMGAVANMVETQCGRTEKRDLLVVCLQSITLVVLFSRQN